MTSRQLAVVKGLVVDRLQRETAGHSAMVTRCPRASYGVKCRQLYRKAFHKGQRPVRDPIDGKKYVENQIMWLIKKVPGPAV
jgi:hypothetical protein